VNFTFNLEMEIIDNMNPSKVFDVLKNLNIDYTEHNHSPIFTIEESKDHWASVKGMHCKNLFLRDNKGKRHYLLCAEAHKAIDLKALSAEVGQRLGFASPKRLMQYLRLEPGSVSPFGLINDDDAVVQVMLDSEIKDVELVNFHPNVNTATLGIHPTDLEKYIRHCGNSFTYVDL